eukprot:TRINITY_DN18265_c0_g1_i1.p1 TRINITY_DN18265_c0_g1~~TRINITY_DN18265_c0_g1_i1.p1  ORF type:complete len:176 (+),score=57.52 TRINITY_DN18265_c0_g1_i1:62-529(+)
MGRRGGGGFGSRSAGTRTQTRPASSSAKAPAPASKPAAPAQTHNNATPAAAPAGYGAPGGGQSFLGGVAQLGAGIAVGHVAGRALENIFFGPRHHATPEEIKEVEKKVKEGPCSFQYESFNRCIEHNENDVAQCDWAFDMFKECQVNNKEQTLNQ